MAHDISSKDLKLICSLRQGWSSQGVSVRKLGGQTNKNWLVVYKRQKFFVRLPWERGDMVDRRIEAENMLRLSQNQKLKSILPRLILYAYKNRNVLDPKSGTVLNVPDGTMVAEYIEGKEFTPRLFSQAKHQKGLANLLHMFHTSNVRFVNPYDVFRDEIEKYRDEAVGHPLRMFFDRYTVRKLARIEKEAKKKLVSVKRGVSTHNDVIFQNILAGEDGRMRLLDFEYAGLNIKGGVFYDLGYVYRDSLFRSSPISRKTFERFLRIADAAYGRRIDREQIYWSVIAATLVGIWWGIVRYYSASKKEQQYFLRYVRRGVKGVLKVYETIKKGL